MKDSQLLALAIKAAILGGEEIIKIYNDEFEVSFKEDNSPLTVADENANAIIESLLEVTNIPILSEIVCHYEFYCTLARKLNSIEDKIDNGTKSVPTVWRCMGYNKEGIIF